MSSSKSPKLIHFMEQWEKLRIAVYEMSPYAKMINQVEEVLEDHSKSKEELAESNLELQDTKAREERLNFFIEEAMTRFEQRLLAVQEQHSSKMLEMNALLEEEKLSVASSRSAHEQSARRCMSLERELESQTRQLSAISEEHKALTSAIGLVDLDNTFPSKLNALAMQLHALARSAFQNKFGDLSSEAKQDKIFKQLISSEFMSNERPIPISNSQPSKYLRIATLEALITQELVSEVFLAVPSYSLWLNHIAPAPDWDTLAREQPLQEAVMRSVSSIVYSEDERDLEEAKINKISDRIASKLRPLEIDQIAFEGKCHKFLQEAFDVWRAVQRSTCRVIALTDGKASIDSPEYDIDEGVSIPHDVLRTARLEPPIVTFPTISAIADSEILHPGYALRTSNPIHISGAIEVEQQVKRARQRG